MAFSKVKEELFWLQVKLTLSFFSQNLLIYLEYSQLPISKGSLTKTERVTLEGFFSNGYMEGPVRGLDEKGNVVFIGAFEEGIPKGPCWLSIEGQGWLHGNVDSKGKFSGENSDLDIDSFTW